MVEAVVMSKVKRIITPTLEVILTPTIEVIITPTVEVIIACWAALFDAKTGSFILTEKMT